jgi:hypothetical protein
MMINLWYIPWGIPLLLLGILMLCRYCFYRGAVFGFREGVTHTEIEINKIIEEHIEKEKKSLQEKGNSHE